MKEYTNDTIYQSLQKYVEISDGEEEILDVSNVNYDAYSNPVYTENDNKSAWERAYSAYKKYLKLSDNKAYLFLFGAIYVTTDGFSSFSDNTNSDEKYIGRGPIRVRWELNYKNVYTNFFCKHKLKDKDIVKHPELADDPYIGSLLSIGWLVVSTPGKKIIEACNTYNYNELCLRLFGNYNKLQELINSINGLLKDNNMYTKK